MTVQLYGETAWDAIVNHNSLDIEEEALFFGFCLGLERLGYGVGPETTLEQLEEAYSEFEARSLRRKFRPF